MSRRILVIRRDNIGDLVLTTPLLAALRAQLPGATIDVLTNSYAAPALAGNPHVNEVHVYTKAHHRSHEQSWLGVYARRVRTVLALRARRYDSIILAKLPAEPRPLAFARMIGAEEIVGLVKPGEAPLCGLTHHVRWSPAFRGDHLVEALHQLGGHFGLSGRPGRTLVFPRTEEVAAARSRLAPLLDRGAPVIALNLSARKVRQRWPAERFVALARALHLRHGYAFMLVWSPGSADNAHHPGDDEKAAEVACALRELPCLAFRTRRLSELFAGLSLASAMFTADGGAMHVGAACGLPIVALFGNSDPGMWHPWQVPYEVVQHRARDVSAITVDEAVKACERVAARCSLQGTTARSARVWRDRTQAAGDIFAAPRAPGRARAMRTSSPAPLARP